MEAAAEGHADVASLLVQSGARTAQRARDGQTALLAGRRGRP